MKKTAFLLASCAIVAAVASCQKKYLKPEISSNVSQKTISPNDTLRKREGFMIKPDTLKK